MNLINKLTVNISIKNNKKQKAKSRTSQADPVSWDEIENKKSRSTALKLSINQAFLHNQKLDVRFHPGKNGRNDESRTTNTKGAQKQPKKNICIRNLLKKNINEPFLRLNHI